MPRINRGAVGAIALYAQEKRKQQEERYKSDQEFQQRLYEAGLKSALESGRVDFRLATGKFRENTPEGFLPEATASLEQTLPRTPFVAGPEGGFITGSQFDALPSAIVPRANVLSSQAPLLANRLSQQRQQVEYQPVYDVSDKGIREIGRVPKGAHLLRQREFEAFPTEEPGLPDPSTLPEGQTATDTETGQRYIVRNHQWVPL